MNCPYCNEELEICSQYTDGTSKLLCNKCDLFGDNRLFEAITKTKQAFDKAIEALKEINADKGYDFMASFEHITFVADQALDQIKQITETKDVK